MIESPLGVPFPLAPGSTNDTDTEPFVTRIGPVPRSAGTSTVTGPAALRHPCAVGTSVESIACHAPLPSRKFTGAADALVSSLPSGRTNVDDPSVRMSTSSTGLPDRAASAACGP